MDAIEICIIIHKRRKELGLTLKQLASLSGVSAAYISRVERGERFPSVTILKTLAKPLQVPEIVLFSWAGYLPDDIVQEMGWIKGQIREAMADLQKRIEYLFPE